MEIAPALLEVWLREYYFNTTIDLGCSGVQNFSMGELRELLGFTQTDLDAVVFNDSQSLGEPGLRGAIARRWADGNYDRVMATHGSSEGMYLIMHALLRAGDEVICLEPVYQPLSAIAESIGCLVQPWRLRFERGYVPDLEELKSLMTTRTRMVVVNFPHNPTGATITLEQQQELIDVVEKAGAYLVWDSAFAELVYEQPQLPDPGLRYERTITLGTLSKAYGLPGLRVGWCLAPPDVLARCIHIRDYITLYLSPLVELIARLAIEKGDLLLDIRFKQARRNLQLLSAWVNQNAEFVQWVRPKGGVSAFLRLTDIPDVEAFCHQLVQERKVLLVPGNCFNHPSHVRLGFGCATSELEQGLEQVSQLLLEQALLVNYG
jgi:capreomycidine synthase